MKKHLHLLALLAALCLPWAMQAQNVSGCAYSTGVDTTKWITLSSSATHITAIEDEDDAPSSCINIGFSFYFGGSTYTQFSCNSNGRFRLGGTPVSNYWTGPFTTLTDAQYNDLPLVTAFGCDNTLEAPGSYVKYELVGTAPNRILVVEYLTPSEYDADGDLVKYQIQLLEDSNRVRLVYGSTAASLYDSYQIGIANSPTDYLMVSATAHTASMGSTSATNSTWPGVGRYYEFTMGMPPSCPAVMGITATHISVGAATFSWSHSEGTPLSYEIEYYAQGSSATPATLTSTTPNITLTGLDSNTTYVVKVRAYCGTDDGYGAWDSTTFTTQAFGCIYDPSSTHSFTSGTGTSQTSGVPVYSNWGNTLCQGIYTAAELIAAGFPSTGADITDLTFTWTNNSSYAKYFTIYMTNTTKDVFGGTTASEWVPTGVSAKVYEGEHPLNTSGAVTYHLTTPFHWDGTSNICVTTTMNQPSGASHSSSSFYGYSTTLSSYYRTLYKYQDSNPLDGSNPNMAANSRSYYRTNITFVSQTCIGLSSCADPIIWIDSMNSTEAYLSWVPGYDETSWDVQYRLQGATSWTTAATGITTTSTTITSLVPGSHYEFRVVNTCGTETHYSNVEVGFTECVPVSHAALPFTNSFEDLTTSSGAPVGSCWARGYYTGSYNPNSYPYASTSYAHSGSKALYFYASGTTTRSWICLPEFADSLNTLRLQFWAKKSSASYTGRMRIGVMTDPTLYSTFQSVRTEYTDATTNWQHFDVSMANAPGAGFITIMVEAVASGSGTNYMYIDDITVDEIPYCTTPVVDSVLVTTNDVNIYMSDIDHAQDISITLTAGTWDTTVVESASPVYIGGLMPGTVYSYSIVSNCGGSQTSNIRNGSFTTVCVPVANESLPFDYGFEDIATTGSGIPLAPCWDRGYLSGSTFYDNNYPYASTSYYHSGTKSLYFYGSGTTTRSWLCLPEFEDSIYSLQLSFWAKKSATSGSGRIVVGVMTDPHTFSTFHPVDTLYTDNTTNWNHFEVMLNAAPGTGYITILDQAVETGSGTNYIYLDDIHVDIIPTCFTPTGLTASNITLSTADLTWNTRMGNETAWLVGNGVTEVEVYDTNYTVTGLVPSSTNTVTVRALCGSGDTSEMAYLSVTTPCGLVPPYSYGFEDMATTSSSSHPNIPCWHHLNNGTSYPGYPYITSTAHTGTRGLYWYGSTTTGTYGDYYYVVLPMLDTANYQMNTLRVKFWARASSTGYHPIVRVGVMTDPTDVSTLQVVNNNIAINPGSSTAWAEFVVNLDTFTGNGAYIAIGAVRPSSAWYMYMDDISVVQIPDCEGVSNFTATNITTSQADLNWTENGNATSWTIEYGPHGFVPGSSAALTETVSTLPHTIYGLIANTEYDVYVTPSCSGLAETFMFTFRTECPAMITLPYTYGFEDLATGSATVAPVIPCWHHLNNSSSNPGYPYVSSTAHNGSRSLYWYNPSSAGTYSDYQTIVLPAIDTDLYPINTLQLKFWAKASSTSYSPVFQVGVMSDPNNVNTFQRLQTVNVGNSAVWTEYVVALGSFTGTGQYIAVHAPLAGSAWYAYTDDFTLEEAPQCPPITNMDVSSVSARGAFVTWGYQSGIIGTPQEYEIEYYEVGGTGTPISLTDTLPQIFLSGLDTNTTYRVRVRANCFEYDYGTWDSITFTTTGLGCLRMDPTTLDTVIFSNSTTGISGCIAYSSYGNTVYQTIYTAAELTAAGLTAGSITGIDLGFTGSSSYAKEFTIFIGTTTTSSISNATMEDPNRQHQVYGPAPHPTNTTGWQHYDFEEPFAWDGTSNIIITTFMNQPSGVSQSASTGLTGYYEAASNKARYRYRDSSPYTLTDYNSGNSGSNYTYRAAIHFYSGECGQQATCAAPMVRATRVSSRDADIEWAAGAYETAWDVEYRMTSSPSWTTVATGTTTTSYTMLNLLPATEYQVRVSHYCATDDSTFTTLITFTTECEPYTVPFIEDFDSYVASSATQLGNCWNKYYSSLNTSSYPYPYASYHHSGNNSLYFYGYSTSYPCWLVLPQMADSIRNLELSFWEYKTTTSYGLVEIGVITDPQDLSTFVPVDTVQVSATSNWQQFFVNFQNYEGPEGRIAMVARTSSSYSFWIDDLEVNRYSTCPRVQALSAYRVTNDSAFLTWQGDSNSLGYRVWWGNSNVITDATDSADLTNARLILGGLGANQTRYVWVSQFCDGGEMSAPVRTVFTTAADCEVVTDLDVHYVTSNSAVFTWNAPEEGYPAARYIVNWQSTSSTVYADTTTNNYYFLSGLDTTTTYSFSVIAICEHESIYDTSFAVSSTFTTHGTRCNYIYGLGTSTSTSSAPLYVTYPYYYGHMLFFADELAQMGDTITSLTFNVTTSGSITRNVDVYLGNSDYENLYTPTFPAYSTLTQVYSGNWTVQNGQCTLTFTTPFVRDHSRNLVVGFDDNTGTANSSSFSFSAAYTINSSTGENIYTVHYNEAQANVNPAIDEAVHVTYVRPIITFGTSCASESCSSPALVVSGNSDSTISLVWNANSGSAWRVEYRLPTDSVWTVAATNVTTNSYVVSGLRVASRYALRVGSICSPTQILYTPIYGETACGDALVPYTDDFNDIVNGWYERTCWRVGNGFNAARSETSTGTSGTYNYPRVVNLTQQGPMLRLYNGAYAVMPHFAEPLYNLQVRFDYLTPFTSDAWTLFGYLTDPNDINTLVVIDTLRHHPTVEGVRLYTIDLDFLSGDVDGNLVFYTPHTLNYTHIDNIYVDLIPPCAIPDSLTCSYTTDTTAELSWWMSNIGSATYMVRYTAYRSGVYDTVYTTGTNTTLTGLIPGTTYDAECYSICLRTGDTSLASNVCRFTTQCAPLPTLPYFLNFEDIPLSTTQTLPNCWEVPVAASMDAAALPQCLFDNPNAAAGYYYLRVQTAAAIAMPQFVAPPDSLMISFYMKTATAGEMVEVGVFDTLVEPVVFRPMDTFTTSSTGYEFFSAYMVGYTGPGTRLGIRTLNSTAVYIDNLTIDYAPTCLPVRRFHADTATASTITLTWSDLTAASQYEIEYGNAGFTRGTGTFVTVTSNPATILGLTPMTNYDFYVRPICSVGDTAEWSAVCHATTAMCDNLVTANSWDSAWTATTSNYAPLGYSFYNYGYVQTIIDAARFAEVEDDITAFAFSAASSDRGDYYNHMDVYMANVSDSNLASSFIMPDSSHQFVQVLHDADLRFSTVGWHLHSFDTAFTWDGHSNVLVVFNRSHGSYVSSPYASFNAHTTSVAKSRYAQQDGTTPFDPTNITATGTTQNLVPDLQFYSCAAFCSRPDIASVTGDYQSATLTWVGTDSLYQVSYRTLPDTTWTAPVDVVGSSYTFTNLQPLTHYELRVRQNCVADSLGYSAWIATFFLTDSLPCFAPDSLTVSNITSTTATFGWVPNGDETAWDIRVFTTSTDTTYTVTTNPATVGGLTAGVTYYAAIRALCGSAQAMEGAWSDSIQFTTQICPTVTGVTTSNVTFNSVTLNWPAAPTAQSYEVEYGMHGFTQGNGTSLPAATNSLTVSGLMDETQYDFYVRAVCGTNWYSEGWSTMVTVTTLSAPSTTFNITATVNPTNAGTVTGTGVYGLGDTATLTATANTGYTFNRWNDNVTLNPRSVVVTSDSAFTAFFTRNQYTVTVTSANQTRGTVTGNGTYYYGDTATLTATAATGYHFTQWNDGDTHAVRTLVVTSDTTFTASFGVNQYTVTATANDASYGTVTGGGTYNFRDTVTLTATANTGYYFRSWNDGNVDNPRTFVVTGDVAYTALFAADSVPPVQTYTVTLNANDANMGIVNGAGTFAEGTSVEISAIANAGYRFVNWNDGVTENPRTFVLTCDTTFTANFAELVDSSAVLVVSFDSEMGYVLINGTEASSYNGLLGDEVSLEAIANEGYHFVEWSDGETSRTRTITLEQSRTTLTATFAVGANGIATVEGSASCLIYPNPASSSTTISVSGVNGKVRIAVVDINGRVAASETMECAGDCVKTMNVDNLSQGAYFVRITGEKVNMVKKLIVR